MSAVTAPPWPRAQRSASRVSAMLSAPPEQAMARRGLVSKGAKGTISAANSDVSSGFTARAPVPSSMGLAARLLLFRRRPLLDRGGRGREVAVEARKGGAGVRLLAEIGERHAELQQIVHRLAVLGIFLIALGEGDGGVVPILAHIIGLAQPVLRVAGERILGIFRHEGAQRLFRVGIIGALQQAEGVVVLILRRGGGGGGGRRRGRRIGRARGIAGRQRAENTAARAHPTSRG